MSVQPRFPLLALVLGALAALGPLPPSGARADTDDEVRAAVLAAWQTALPPGTTVEVLQLPRLPATEGDIGALEVDPPGLPVVAGVRPVAVSRRVAGRVVARGLATVRVRRAVPVWVTARAVTSGTVLTDEDVKVESRVFEREPAREQTGEFAPGRWIARHGLAADAVVRSTDVARRPDVASGAPLNLVVRAGEARVSVPAIARRGGNIGETILVSNPVTGALVSAVLVDAATAELSRPADNDRIPLASGGSAP